MGLLTDRYLSPQTQYSPGTLPFPLSSSDYLVSNNPTRTVVHNVLVGSVSFASSGAKALHNASTAQEITVITPSARDLSFRVRGLSEIESTITNDAFAYSDGTTPRPCRPV